MKFTWCLAAAVFSSQLLADSVKVQMLEGEHWWGLASGMGTAQPYTRETDIKLDLRVSGFGNQTSSLLLSSSFQVPLGPL